MEQQQNENSHASAQSRAEGANLTDVLGIEEGSRVRFTGYVTASFDFPRVDIGSEGIVVSAKQGTKLGYDFWVQLDDGRRLAFSKNEISEIPNVELTGTP